MTKTFDDADEYLATIRNLVPGYDLIHALVPRVLAARGVGEGDTLLVVGCGPGHELVALCEQLPGIRVDAVDTSAEMVASASRRVADAGLEGVVRVVHGGVEAAPAAEGYTIALSSLVAHFLTDDGARADFYSGVATRLRPAGRFLSIEIMDDEALGATWREAHVAWSRARGSDDARAEVLATRLRTEFATLTSARLAELSNASGMLVEGAFFQALGVVGNVLAKRA